MIWLAVGALALVVAALLSRPLWRRRSASANAAPEVVFYRDQLAEIERDAELGTLTRAEADAARLEVQRRLLAVAPAAERDTATAAASPLRARLGFAVPLLAIVLAGSLALYLEIGAPDAARVASGDHTMSPDAQEFARLVDQLQVKLKENPRDLDGWLLLARSLRTLERLPDSAEAYMRALALSGGRADIASAYGELLIEIAQGTVTPEAMDLFRQALAREPGEPRARFYLGLAKAQSGDTKGAIADWTAMLNDAPPDAPYAATVREQIADAAEAAGVPVPPIASPPASAASPPTSTGSAASPPTSTGSAASPRGPSAADMAAAANMSPEDRQTMIRGMVDGLAARLKDNPDDVDGWQRLGRAYTVLGESEKARAALDEAAKRGGGSATAPTGPVASAAPSPRSTGSAAAPRGPSAADMAAAANMSPEDRQTMIRGMVDGLAARLKDNPDDVEGWLRLGRAYGVLGEPEKARAALTEGAQHAPDRVDVLTQYAQAIYTPERAADKPPPEFVAVMRRILTLDPSNAQALWFVGNDAAAAGDKKQAAVLFKRLLDRLPPNAPLRPQVQRQLEAVGG